MPTDQPAVFESLKMMQTKHFIEGCLRPSGPKFKLPFFFSLKNLVLSVTRYHGQLS